MENLLVIDDDKIIYLTIKAILQNHFKVYHSSKMNEAAFMLRTKSFSTILLDRYLGSENGLELLNQLKQESVYSQKIFLVSGYDISENLNLLINEKISGFIKKPFNSEQLLNTVLGNKSPDKSDLSDQLCKIFEENPMKNIKLVEFATENKINPTSLNKNFKRKFGTSPYKMYLLSKMQKIAELLLETNLTFKDICRITGYKSIPSALKTFKKIYKTTPGKYRITSQ